MPPANTIRVVLLAKPLALRASFLAGLTQAIQTGGFTLPDYLAEVPLNEDGSDQTRNLDNALQEDVLTLSLTPHLAADSADKILVRFFVPRQVSFEAAFASPLSKPATRLARALDGADAVVLVADEAATEKDVDSTIDDYARFLPAFEERRGTAAKLNGLPVFVLMTRPGAGRDHSRDDKAPELVARLAKRVEAVGDRGRGRRLFGAVRIWPCGTYAVRPAVSEALSSADTGGVGDCLRSVVEAALAFRAERQRASRRLAITSAAMGIAIAAMMAGAAFLLLVPPHEPSELEGALAAYRLAEGDSPAERLQEPIARKVAALQRIESMAGFGELPRQDREFVRQRLEELTDYRMYKDRLTAIRLDDARSIDALKRLAGLVREQQPPEPYRRQWEGTDASRLRQTLLGEAQALETQAEAALAFFRGAVADSERLRDFAGAAPKNGLGWAQWLQAASTLRESQWSPASSADLHLPPTIVLAYEEVAAARRDWELERLRLDWHMHLILALGLGDSGGQPSHRPLDIPDDFRAQQASDVLHKLDKAFPDWRPARPRAALSDAALAVLAPALGVAYDRLLEAGRRAVLEELQRQSPDGQETLERWGAVRDWLAKGPDELRAWSTLLQWLVHVRRSGSANAVDELKEFLSKDVFVLNLPGFALGLPAGSKVTPSGPVTVYLQRGEGKPATWVFPMAETASSGAVAPHAKFTSEAAVVIRYAPGDLLWAELPVRRAEAEGDWQLTWSICRSQVYQFERLVRHPRLHRKEQPNTEGTILEAFLTVASGGEIPSVPSLLPVVRLTKR